jgi:hypothetical protein
MARLLGQRGRQREVCFLFVSSVWLLMRCSGARAGSSQPRSASTSIVADTMRPAVPADWTEQLDTALTVPFPANPKARYYRHRFLLAFKPTASGLAIREVLARYRATIVGGMPEFKPRGAYIIAIPDPGPDAMKWKAIYDSLASEPTVALAVGLEAGSRFRPAPDG